MKFELNEAEVQLYMKWNEAHKADKHGGTEPYAGACGGRINFQFCCTSLGDIATVSCGLCPDVEPFNITDWENWG